MMRYIYLLLWGLALAAPFALASFVSYKLSEKVRVFLYAHSGKETPSLLASLSFFFIVYFIVSLAFASVLVGACGELCIIIAGFAGVVTLPIIVGAFLIPLGIIILHSRNAELVVWEGKIPWGVKILFILLPLVAALGVFAVFGSVNL